MLKIDIESAYRCIPVQPIDWPLLGLQWEDSFYFDTVMQFGIASATAIFEWYSSAAQYIVERTCSIKYMVHYVDDFLMFVQTYEQLRSSSRSRGQRYSKNLVYQYQCPNLKAHTLRLYFSAFYSTQYK